MAGRKKRSDKENKPTIFNLAEWLFYEDKKDIFEKENEEICKLFNAYMITRILSFHGSKRVKGVAETVNKYTFLYFGELTSCENKMIFQKLVYAITPKWNKKQFFKYVKRKTENIPEEFYSALRKHYGEELSKKELGFIYQYLAEQDKEHLVQILLTKGVSVDILVKSGLINKKENVYVTLKQERKVRKRLK